MFVRVLSFDCSAVQAAPEAIFEKWLILFDLVGLLLSDQDDMVAAIKKEEIGRLAETFAVPLIFAFFKIASYDLLCGLFFFK